MVFSPRANGANGLVDLFRTAPVNLGLLLVVSTTFWKTAGAVHAAFERAIAQYDYRGRYRVPTSTTNSATWWRSW